MLNSYSKVYSLACITLDRLKFILKDCYMSQSVKIQVEASIKDLTRIIEILDGKEEKEDIDNIKKRKKRKIKKYKPNKK